MNKFFGFLLIILLFACKKSNDGTINYPYHLNATINSINYTTNSVATFGLNNEPGCIANKSFDVINVGQINVDDYYLDCYFKHYTNNIDFVSTKPGNHRIFDGGDLLKANQCNGDLIIGLIDNNIPNLYNNTILQPNNIVNKITNITKIDSSVNTITYSVKGNFSCSFKNTNNVIISVSGDYALPVKEAK